MERKETKYRTKHGRMNNNNNINNNNNDNNNNNNNNNNKRLIQNKMMPCFENIT